MARPKKDGRFINCYLDNHILEQLERFCESTGLSKTAAIEVILGGFFNADAPACRWYFRNAVEIEKTERHKF